MHDNADDNKKYYGKCIGCEIYQLGHIAVKIFIYGKGAL